MNLEEFPKEYQRLIKQVQRIDEKAAKYLLEEAPKLEYFSPAYYLMGSFIYEKTPQGYGYWEEIGAELQKQRAKYADLVQRIADLGVDQDIIDYLNNEAMDLGDFELTDQLLHAFTWSYTPQGGDFWLLIRDRLSENAFPEGNPPASIPEYPDLEAVQKRFFKLLSFKREHCPDTVFEPFQDNYTVVYKHAEKCWVPVFAHEIENPTAIFLSEETAYLLASQLNSGEFEL